MVENIDKCIDSREEEYLKNTLDEIGQAMGCVDAKAGTDKLVEILGKLGLEIPVATQDQYQELIKSVNPIRLKNHPIALNIETIDKLYHEILR